MRKIIVLMLILSFFSTLCFADQGIVINKEKSRYAIEYSKGFLLVEWQGGYRPSVGDVYNGDFHTIGFRKLKCINMQEETNFWIENYGVDRDMVEIFLNEKKGAGVL